MSNPKQMIHPSHKNIFFNIHKLGSVKTAVLAVDEKKENNKCESCVIKMTYMFDFRAKEGWNWLWQGHRCIPRISVYRLKQNKKHRQPKKKKQDG